LDIAPGAPFFLAGLLRCAKLHADLFKIHKGIQMKRALAILIALVVVIAAAYYLVYAPRQETAPTSTLPASVNQEALQPLAPGLADKLSENTLLFVSVTPRKLDAVINYLANFYSRAMQTRLAQKVGYPQQIEQAFMQGMISDLTEPDAQSPQAQERVAEIKQGWEKIKAVWGALGEINVAVSGSTFVSAQGRELPKILAQVNVLKPEAAADLSNFLDQQVLKGQPQMQQGELTLRKGSAPGLYDLQVQKPGQQVELSALLQIMPAKINFLVGAKDENEFYATPALAASSNWQRLQQMRRADNWLFSYLGREQIANYLDKAMQAMPQDQTRGDAEMLRRMTIDQWKDLSALAYALNAAGGMGAASCFVMRPGSAMDQAQVKAFAARQGAGAKSQVEKLISARSIIAVRALMLGADSYLDYFLNLWKSSLSLPSGDKTYVDTLFERIKSEYQTFGFKEFGLVINAPAGLPVPEVGIYLGEGKLAGEEALRKLAALIDEISASGPANANAQAPMKMAELTTGSQGQTLLQINAGGAAGGMPLVGSAAANNSLLFGLSEIFISEADKALTSGTGFLSGTLAAKNPAVAQLAAADYYWYLNSQPAIVALKSFIPLLAMQAPEKQLTPEDFDQALDLITGAVILTQNTKRDESGVVCAEGRLDKVQ
jgi:fructose-specific component phosphotransferase system IIB-like protein